MIPLLVPPLTDLHVLVTRPARQSQALCNQIQQLGGVAISLPVLEIKPREVTLPTQAYDLIIFSSANAVTYGLKLLQSQSGFSDASHTLKIAAVGNATATALAQAGFPASIIAASPANSESLLAHAALQTPPARILLVRGVGGRETLRDTLIERGSDVAVLEVYQRVPATIDNNAHAELTKALQDGIDVITVTSVDILHALNKLLDDNERAAAQRLIVLAGSVRIAAQLPMLGWCGECIVADSPEDAALLTALTRWYTRGRN